MATRAEQAFRQGIQFQKKMQEWFGTLHNFMQVVGQNHSHINHVWEADVMQKEYAQHWSIFEADFRKEMDIVLRLNHQFVELMRALGAFIRRQFQRVDIIPIKEVEKLHAWPASAHSSTLTIERVLQQLHQYHIHIENFIPKIVNYKRELTQPLKDIHSLIESRKITPVLNGLIRDVEKWLTQLQAVLQQLKQKLSDIIQHVQDL